MLEIPEHTDNSFAQAPPSDVYRLSWTPCGTRQRQWYRPDYQRCLTQVLPTVLRLLDYPTSATDLLPFLPKTTPQRVKRVLLLTVDSFGFREWGHTRYLQNLYPEYGTWITSVFPTITSCALSSLYQGLAPARHGLTGHKIWKNCPGAIVDVLNMHVDGAEHSLTKAGFDASVWKREPGILDELPIEPPLGYHLLPRPIVNSGLSTFSYGHLPRVPYGELIEGFQKAAWMLREMSHGFVSLYMPLIDSLTHVLGGSSDDVALGVQHIETLLKYMANHLPARIADETSVFIVADHGQSRLRKRRILYGEPMAWLQAHTHAVGFSGRVMHVYLRGLPEAPVRAWLEDWLADDGEVVDFAQAQYLVGLTGKEATVDRDWVRHSLGDLVVILEDGVLIQRHKPEEPLPPYKSNFVSQHGALTWHELFVPILCAPLSAVADA